MIDLDPLLPEIQAGNAQDFGIWVAHCEEPLRRSLRSFATAVDTEAVLQETLLRCWQLAPRIKQDNRGNSLLRFAHRVARNLALDEARRHRRQVAVDVEEAADELAPMPSLPDPFLRRAIEACRDLLPKQPKQALTKRLEGGAGRSDTDLAAELGMRLNTFLKNFGRARTLLAACLDSRNVAWRGEQL